MTMTAEDDDNTAGGGGNGTTNTASNGNDIGVGISIAGTAKTAATSTTPLIGNREDEPPPANYGGSSSSSSSRRHHDRDRDYGGHDGDFVTVNEDRDLARGLQQRHVSLIAIAGAIGTGLFLGLGSAVRTGGPLGALLGYATVGLVVCAVQFALGEVTALLPVTGSFVRHAEFLVDPALGFAIGWNIVYGNWLSIPAEISAICVLFEFWTDANPALWISLSILLTSAVGLSLVRVYGEVEFWFALVKILFIVFLVVLGLAISLGGVPGVPARGFRYWADPGAFVEHPAAAAGGPGAKFLGYWAVMSSAVFSFAGTESVAMAAAETRSPRQVIPRACRRVFARVALFYVLAVLVVGMLVASDDPRLGEASGTAAQSPFVIAAGEAGIAAIPHVVNAVVITSAWSSANQALLSGTRVLYALALKRQAPAVFLCTTAWGVPWVCVAVQAAFMLLAFAGLSAGALAVFYWFVSLTAAGVLVSWSTILLNHQRLLLALRAQGIPAAALPWHNPWTRYSTPVALGMCLLILFTAGFEVFTPGGWDASAFVSHYVDIPLVLAAFGAWKAAKGTRLVGLGEIPLREALEEIRRNPEPVEPEPKGWQRALGFLWD